MPRLPRRQQRTQIRMQAEEAIEVNCALIGGDALVIRTRNPKCGPMRVVRGLAVRDENVERVGGPAQKHDDERVAARRTLRWGECETRHPGRPSDSAGE